MTEFTLREQSDRYLLGKITIKQLNYCMDEIIINEMRYGERDEEESRLASTLLSFFSHGDTVRELHGYFDEEEFRIELAAHFYMEQLTRAKAKPKAKAVAS